MSRADIHQFGWPNSELIMSISRVNRPQSRGWFDYSIAISIPPNLTDTANFLANTIDTKTRAAIELYISPPSWKASGIS